MVEGSSIKWAEVILNGRGAVGETVLHLCCLMGTEAHLKVAEYLMKTFGSRMCNQRYHKRAAGGKYVKKVKSKEVKYIDATYTGLLYRGECALHLAVARNDLRCTKMLLEYRANMLSPFAHGEFFRDFLYYGGTVLAFAAINASRELFQLLIKKGGKMCEYKLCFCVALMVEVLGAQVDSIDQLGNSLLHLCVLHSRKEAYEYLVTNHRDKLQRFFKAPNNHGYSPLFLAAFMRNQDMYKLVEENNSSTLWRFGDIGTDSCSAAAS